ncbi:MAG: 23S rRNA (guanosine(2251)-2'-O)-methyltransferase RlmB [bacterium]|jgi:23S rRNA (guanosine2251-2'-O)-methyltransferase
MSNEPEIVYGRQPVCELLRAGRRDVKRLLMANNVRQSSAAIVQLLKLAEKRSLEIQSMALFELDRLCRGGNHQGVAAMVAEYPYAELADLIEESKLRKLPLLMLLVDHVQDPQNLGSMIRSADAAGVNGVVIARHRAVSVTPAVVRASAGATEYVPVAQVVNLHQAMLTLKEEGVRLVGLEGSSEAVSYEEADLTGPIGVVVGSEEEGLGKLIRETCDVVIRLPMRGHVGSLNAAVAAAIAMFEVRRRQGQAAI